MTIRSYTNSFEVVDVTRELVTLPQTWSLLGDSGLFKDEFLTTPTVTFQEQTGSIAIVKDSLRGAKPQTTSNDIRRIRSYSVPHFILQDALYPSDLAGKSAYNDLNQADTEAAALLRKMTKIRKSFDVTKEIARFSTITTGQAWAPNGTIVADYYSDFGFTRKEVDFLLGSATTSVIAKSEEILRSFQDSATDGVIINRITAYCSPVFFSKLIEQSRVQAAFNFAQMSAGGNIQRERAGGAGMYRRFDFGHISYIEVPTVLAGQSLIPSGDAYFVAETDDDAFTTFYAPAERFNLVNTTAMPMYMFTKKEDTEIVLTASMDMLNVLKRPNFVARAYSSN